MPPSRKSLGKRPQTVVHDSDSGSEIESQSQSQSQSRSSAKPPKFEKIDPEYLNKQVDPTKADTKLRQLIAETKLAKTDIAKVIQTVTQAAVDLATVGAKDAEELDFDDDHIPKDEVSSVWSGWMGCWGWGRGSVWLTGDAPRRVGWPSHRRRSPSWMQD